MFADGWHCFGVTVMDETRGIMAALPSLDLRATARHKKSDGLKKHQLETPQPRTLHPAPPNSKASKPELALTKTQQAVPRNL